MKNLVSIIVLLLTIYSLTSCASSQKGHGCGYWSTTEISQEQEREYQFVSHTEPTCLDAITTN